MRTALRLIGLTGLLALLPFAPAPTVDRMPGPGALADDIARLGAPVGPREAGNEPRQTNRERSWWPFRGTIADQDPAARIQVRSDLPEHADAGFERWDVAVAEPREDERVKASRKRDTVVTAAVAADRAAAIGSVTGTGQGVLRRALAGDNRQGAAWDEPAVLEVLSVSDGGQVMRGGDFPKDLVRYLRILVWWSVAGLHAQRLDFFAPDGHLYQRFSAEFDADDSSSRQRFGQSLRTPVETRLLVGGTWITEHALFGAWRVDVYLDSQPAPIASASFVLSP